MRFPLRGPSQLPGPARGHPGAHPHPPRVPSLRSTIAWRAVGQAPLQRLPGRSLGQRRRQIPGKGCPPPASRCTGCLLGQCHSQLPLLFLQECVARDHLLGSLGWVCSDGTTCRGRAGCTPTPCCSGILEQMGCRGCQLAARVGGSLEGAARLHSGAGTPGSFLPQGERMLYVLVTSRYGQYIMRLSPQPRELQEKQEREEKEEEEKAQEREEERQGT